MAPSQAEARVQGRVGKPRAAGAKVAARSKVAAGGDAHLELHGDAVRSGAVDGIVGVDRASSNLASAWVDVNPIADRLACDRVEDQVNLAGSNQVRLNGKLGVVLSAALAVCSEGELPSSDSGLTGGDT